MAAVIYSLCAITGALCACLLTRAYLRLRSRLLLWSSICFAGLALNNIALWAGQVGASCNGSFGSQNLDWPFRNADSIIRTDLGGALMTHLADALSDAAAMASLAVALLFLKFWRRTPDSFFLLFAAAFAIDAASRFALGISPASDTTEPIYFLPHLVMFGLIAVAIIGRTCHATAARLGCLDELRSAILIDMFG